jgi:hypothetical protein
MLVSRFAFHPGCEGQEMNVPKKNLRRDTRVFFSAVTRELGSVRKLG